VQRPLSNNQDIQQSLEFMCTLHHIHLHHLLGQVIVTDPQHKFQHQVGLAAYKHTLHRRVLWPLGATPLKVNDLNKLSTL